jgi:hypothetical protein
MLRRWMSASTETHNYATVPRNVPSGTEQKPVETEIAELPAERMLPNVDDLDELVVEPWR